MTIKKTMHELVKEFPNKTYRELEKYRDADRQQEAQRIFTQQANEELKEDQHKENWEEKYKKEHKLRQEAEGELTIIKGIETNRVKEYIEKNNDLLDELDELKKHVDPAHKIQKARESDL